MSALSFGIKITAVNAAASVLKGVRDNISSIANANRQVKKSYDDTIKSLKRTAVAALATGAAIKGIGAGVKQAATVAEAISKARAELLRSGKSAKQLGNELNSIRESATQIQAVTVFDTKQIVEAQVMLLKAGKTMEDITNTSDGLAVTIAKIATIMEDTPENVATGFLKVTDTFQDTEHSAGQLADTIVRASGTANTNFTDMATVIGRAGGVAKSVGVSFDDMVAGAALAFNKFAGQPERLSTGMLNFFSRAKDVDALIEDGELVKLPEIVDRLNKRLDGLTSQERAKELERLFGKDVYTGLFINTLLEKGAKGFEDYNKKIKEMADLTQKTNAVMDNSSKQADAARGSLGSLVAEVFKDLETILGGVISKFNDLLAKISTFVSKKPAISKTVTALSGIGLALLAGSAAFFGIKALKSGASVLKGVGGIKGLFARQAGLGIGLAKGKALQQAGIQPVYVVNASEIGGIGGVGGVGGLGSSAAVSGLMSKLGITAAAIAPTLGTALGSALAGVGIGVLINMLIKNTAIDRFLQKGADKVYDFFFETPEEKLERQKRERAAEEIARERRAPEVTEIPFSGTLPGPSSDTVPIINNITVEIDSKKANPTRVLQEQTSGFNRGNLAKSLFGGSDTTGVR